MLSIIANRATVSSNSIKVKPALRAARALNRSQTRVPARRAIVLALSCFNTALFNFLMTVGCYCVRGRDKNIGVTIGTNGLPMRKICGVFQDIILEPIVIHRVLAVVVHRVKLKSPRIMVTLVTMGRYCVRGRDKDIGDMIGTNGRPMRKICGVFQDIILEISVAGGEIAAVGHCITLEGASEISNVG